MGTNQDNMLFVLLHNAPAAISAAVNSPLLSAQDVLAEAPRIAAKEHRIRNIVIKAPFFPATRLFSPFKRATTPAPKQKLNSIWLLPPSLI
jgi:hypothetical protein